MHAEKVKKSSNLPNLPENGISTNFVVFIVFQGIKKMFKHSNPGGKTKYNKNDILNSKIQNEMCPNRYQ